MAAASPSNNIELHLTLQADIGKSTTQNTGNSEMTDPDIAGEKAAADSFTWLSRWIMYFPLVVSSQLKNGHITKRNHLFSILYLCFAATGVLGLCYSYTVPNFSYGFGLYPVVYLIAMLLQTGAACISLFYFWKCFDFHTLRTVHIEGDIKITKKANLRMQVLLSALILCIITLILVKIIELSISDDTMLMDLLYLSRSISYYALVDVPLFLSQLILSIYYCKGGIFISHLEQIIETDKEVDFGSVCKEYQTFRSQFKSSIKLLEYALKCKLCAVVFWIWIDLTEIVEADSVMDEIQNVIYLIMGAIPFVELVMAGSSATTKYHSFKKIIYAIQMEELSLKLLYLLNYVVVYPFLVKIFAKEISIKNSLKVTAAFAAAKTLAYLFRNQVN